MTLTSVPITIRLTSGVEVPWEFTGDNPDSLARRAVAVYHKANPTKRIEWLRLNYSADFTRTYVPHMDCWLEELPEFAKAAVPVPAYRRDGHDPVDGTEM